MIDAQRVDQLVAATDSWRGGVPVPSWFDPEPGETVYAVISGVELIELRETEPPLNGGSSDVELASTDAMAGPHAAKVRSIWLRESVPAREVGAAVVTSARLVFVGERSRSWRYGELQDLTHDNAVPETWLSVDSRKRISGVRYPGAAALELRFSLSLALATERDQRAALRAWLLAQRPSPAPVWGQAPASATATTTPAWLSKTGRGLSLVYLGKRGLPLPLRIAQGALAAFATLALLGAVLPEAEPKQVELAAEKTNEKVDEAAQQAEIATKKAAEEKARLAAEEQARKEAEQAAAAEAERKAAEEQARLAAEEQARLAAEEQARLAAEKKAAEERAAAEKAAAEAARLEAERQAAAKAAAPAAPQRAVSSSGCMAEYPDFCIPAGPDLDCPDIGRKNFTVLRPDTFRFDADNDGFGCDS